MSERVIYCHKCGNTGIEVLNWTRWNPASESWECVAVSRGRHAYCDICEGRAATYESGSQEEALEVARAWMGEGSTRRLIELCNQAILGADEKALRLLSKFGADPDLKLPGLWPARRYAKQHRARLPQTWAWMERQRLSEVARKRKGEVEEATVRRAM
ncbi:hypothetical protein [Pseudomonas sp. Hp2]|uniref:hypothetical protein n=1 Tax=Pseudomonas sp. Hp2 TaxID=701189 RepID=UPI0015ABB06F|nr:hypothetical protein [Pseudomonas sp. Hp2]